MKTLEDFKITPWMKTEYASGLWVDVPYKTQVKILIEAAELYAAHVWEEAIAAQKLICAEHVDCISIEDPDWDGRGIVEPLITVVDKDSILNAPDAVNPFKK